jgi:3-oxoacyl-(acyl-carrier-protein) synthase
VLGQLDGLERCETEPFEPLRSFGRRRHWWHQLEHGPWHLDCQLRCWHAVVQGPQSLFYDGADGYGRGEGCACGVIQKGKQSDENAFALLAATHTNSCGRSASLTAPNGPAQQRLLKAVLEETKRSITEISLYEAHGTGTMLGDPIELGAVQKVLARGRENGLIVSCSKTNMATWRAVLACLVSSSAFSL